MGFPKAEVKNKTDEYFYNLWEMDFTKYPHARMGKCFYKGPDKCKAKYVLKLSRKKLARFVRIISGHNSLFYFRNKVDNEVNANCRFCLEEDETFRHLINDCPRFIIHRRDKLQNQYITNDHRSVILSNFHIFQE